MKPGSVSFPSRERLTTKPHLIAVFVAKLAHVGVTTCEPQASKRTLWSVVYSVSGGLFNLTVDQTWCASFAVRYASKSIFFAVSRSRQSTVSAMKMYANVAALASFLFAASLLCLLTANDGERHPILLHAWSRFCVIFPHRNFTFDQSSWLLQYAFTVLFSDFLNFLL